MRFRPFPAVLILLAPIGLGGCRGCQQAPSVREVAVSAGTESVKERPVASGGGAPSGATISSVGPSRTRVVDRRVCQGDPVVESSSQPAKLQIQFKSAQGKDGPGNLQLVTDSESGCLAYDLDWKVMKETKTWRIYRVVEYFADRGERVIRVVEPRGYPCEDCDKDFDLAKLPVDCRRTSEVGLRSDPLDPGAFPVTLEWNAVRRNPETMDRRALWNPNGPDVAFADRALPSQRGAARVQFCLDDLRKLAQDGEPEYWLVIRASFGNGAESGEEVVFSQTPLTRERILSAIEQITKLKPGAAPR